MFELTDKQLQEMTGPEPCAVDPVTNIRYVLVREDVYRRLKAICSDDAVVTTADMLDKVMADDDVHDPWLEELQKKYGSQ